MAATASTASRHFTLRGSRSCTRTENRSHAIYRPTQGVYLIPKTESRLHPSETEATAFHGADLGDRRQQDPPTPLVVVAPLQSLGTETRIHRRPVHGSMGGDVGGVRRFVWIVPLLTSFSEALMCSIHSLVPPDEASRLHPWTVAAARASSRRTPQRIRSGGLQTTFCPIIATIHHLCRLFQASAWPLSRFSTHVRA